MSRKSDPRAPRAVPRRLDPRARKTRDALGDALVQLVHEKPFDAITVHEVLERAGVARSTFYAHFRDKDDLFLSDADEFFESLAMRLSRCGERSRRVAPVRELLAHVGEMRAFHAALVSSGKLHDLMELLRAHLARGIEQRLTELPEFPALDATERAIAAHAYAGAVCSLLAWWLASGTRTTPEEVDARFHRLVWSGVGGTESANVVGDAGVTSLSPMSSPVQRAPR